MKALRVHGDGALFVKTSCNVGLRGQYGPDDPGMDTLKGLEGISPADMKPSSSASQSEIQDDGEDSLVYVCRCNEGGFRCFDLRIALRRYFIGTQFPTLSHYRGNSGTSFS